MRILNLHGQSSRKDVVVINNNYSRPSEIEVPNHVSAKLRVLLNQPEYPTSKFANYLKLKAEGILQQAYYKDEISYKLGIKIKYVNNRLNFKIIFA